MSTRIALTIALLVAALAALDAWMGWGGGLVVARGGVDLIHRLAFWR